MEPGRQLPLGVGWSFVFGPPPAFDQALELFVNRLGRHVLAQPAGGGHRQQVQRAARRRLRGEVQVGPDQTWNYFVDLFGLFTQNCSERSVCFHYFKHIVNDYDA